MKKTVDYTYYLGSETGKRLRSIIDNLRILADFGYAISIRPHPRYTNMSELRDIDSNLEVEDVNCFCIESSISRTRNAISFFSTVLNQAFYNNVGIILDDVSNPKDFFKLSNAEYIMFAKEHLLFSKLIQKCFLKEVN